MKKLFVGAAVTALVMTYVALGPPPLVASSNELRRGSPKPLGEGGSPAIAQAQRADVSTLPSFGEPGISPDGSTIAFVSGGDIWEVPA